VTFATKRDFAEALNATAVLSEIDRWNPWKSLDLARGWNGWQDDGALNVVSGLPLLVLGESAPRWPPASLAAAPQGAQRTSG
jgi:hypothetical protein